MADSNVDKKVLDQIIWNKFSEGKTADIVSSGDSFAMETMPFKAKFSHNVQDEKPFVYEDGDKSISFKPIKMEWGSSSSNSDSVSTFKAISSIGCLTDSKVKYPSVFGDGIDITCSTERAKWRKEITAKRFKKWGCKWLIHLNITVRIYQLTGYQSHLPMHI